MNIPSYMSGTIFAKAHKALRQAVRGCLNQHGLTPTDWNFLGAVLNAPDGIRLVKLADHLGVKAPLVTAIANRLIAQGLVQRIPHHTDRRAKLLVITPEGKRFVDRVERDMDGALKQLMTGVSVDDLTAYQRVLDTIIINSTKTKG
ncbi:MAG TPA: MarR family transcriptional regulator [Candidatus Saccharimonadales bacterium]|nr:MarR family transcriptional regulator [Candidatus Saccharimonadales bacterium]